MAQPMIPHRGPEMTSTIESIRTSLQTVYRTTGDVMVWPGSGSAGWEVAIQNSCQPGDTVVAMVCGHFGMRFADVAEQFGLHVVRVDVPWGQATTAELLATALAEHRDVRAVLVTHNETSTGVTNPLAEIAEVARKAGVLTLVDAVSSAAAIPLETEAWGLDWVISGAQKAWMCPPGLMLAAASERALDVAAKIGNPRFFWDVGRMVASFRQGALPTTPPITLLWALDAALNMVVSQGVESTWARHDELGQQTRKTLTELGLDLYADPSCASASLTAFRPPAGTTASQLRDLVRDDSGVELAVGQGSEADRIVRVGHMGWTRQPEMDATFESLRRVCERLS
jgi:aspartate aminotransferase-like enzyme